MRTYVLVSFFIEAVSAGIFLLALAALEKDKWSTLFKATVAIGFSIWAACLLWR